MIKTPFEITHLKASGTSLSPSQIDSMVRGFTSGKISESRMTKWLEAVFKQGMDNAETLTAENDGIQVNMALNYGARQEILQAAADWAAMCHRKGITPDAENAELYFSDFLMTKDIPDPDLLIRTSGEKRVSNFLLWQCAYAELYFSDVYWPDFNRESLEHAIADYCKRDRRFGKIGVSD